MNKFRAHTEELARLQHWLHQCAFCNANLWLDLIRKHMTGLQTIEVFAYLDDSGRLPTLGDSWVVRLFQLQHGQNGLRDLKIRLYPGQADGPWMPLPNGTRPPNLQSVMQLDALLQEKIRKGTKNCLPSSPPVEGVFAP